jgi:adenosylhomocysteine nucleosidase
MQSHRPSDLPAANLSACHVGVVYAMALEAAALEKRLTGVLSIRGKDFSAKQGGWKKNGVVVVSAGVGQKRAAQGTELLITGHRPRWVVAAGLAGGLRADLKVGDIVMPDCLLNENGDRLAIDFNLASQPSAMQAGLHVGALLTIDRVANKAAEKERLGRQHQAIAVDMETMAIAEICRREKQRFLAVRVIFDPLAQELPADVERLVRKSTLARRIGATAGTVLRRPSSIKDLWHFRETAIACSERLAKFLEGVIEQLGAA